MKVYIGGHFGGSKDARHQYNLQSFSFFIKRSTFVLFSYFRSFSTHKFWLFWQFTTKPYEWHRNIWGILDMPATFFSFFSNKVNTSTEFYIHFNSRKNFRETAVNLKVIFKKSVRRAIFRNIEVRVDRGFAPFNPYFVCDTAAGRCVICKESSYTKNEYNFIQQFFWKKRYFPRKLFWGHIWPFF